ncbi:MAG: 50S ribosomal protein L17 [bacterium]
MRHRVNGRKFDRNTGSRKALFRNLATQVFKHDRVVTTHARAKEVRRIVEKLITKARREDLHARRQVLRVVTDKSAVKRLFDIILAKVSNRTKGGYTRIVKLGNRKGDDAPMALLEILEPGATSGKSRKKKAGKGKAKGKKAKEKAAPAAKAAPAEKAAPPEEAPVTEPTAAEAPSAEETTPAPGAEPPSDKHVPEERSAGEAETDENEDQEAEEKPDKD